MGIRIHKDIGYFLPKKLISTILIKEYDDIIDDLYNIDDSIIQKIITEFNNVKNSSNNPIGFTFAEIQLNELLKSKENNIHSFFKSIFNYDTFKGVLFLTPELAKSSRFDDLIDYYEHVNKPVFKLNFLKCSLYPDNYYICVKAPNLTKNAQEVYAEETPKKPVLEIGDLISADKLHFLTLMNGQSIDNKRINPWVYPKNSEKYFHPYVNVITYAFAKAINILKPNISYIEFSQLLEPAIVTHWG